MTSILGQQGTMIFWSVVAVLCLASVVLRLTGVRRRDGDGSWLQDKVRGDAYRVIAQMGPSWMQGRLGTVIYGLLGAAFLIIVFSSVAVRLVNGPTNDRPAASPTETPATDTKTGGGF